MVVSDAEIQAAVSEVISEHREKLESSRYMYAVKILAAVRNKLPFADVGAVQTECDKQILAVLGPKTELDDPKAAKKAKLKADKVVWLDSCLLLPVVSPTALLPRVPAE